MSKHGARVALGAFHVGMFNEIDANDDFLSDARGKQRIYLTIVLLKFIFTERAHNFIS